MTTTYTAARHPCGTCGSEELLRADGTVRAHREMRHNRGGVYRSGQQCSGTGQPPELVEDVELEPAAGGA